MEKAIVVREFRRQFQRNRLHPLWAVPFAINAFVIGPPLYLLLNTPKAPLRSMLESCGAMYVLTLTILLLLAFPITAAGIIRYESLLGRLELLRLSNFSPIQLIRGFFCTLVLQCLPFLIFTLPAPICHTLLDSPVAGVIWRKVFFTAICFPLLLAMGLAFQRKERKSGGGGFLFMTCTVFLVVYLNIPIGPTNPLFSFLTMKFGVDFLRECASLLLIVPIAIGIFLRLAADRLFPRECKSLATVLEPLGWSLCGFTIATGLIAKSGDVALFLLCPVVVGIAVEILLRRPPITSLSAESKEFPDEPMTALLLACGLIIYLETLLALLGILPPGLIVTTAILTLAATTLPLLVLKVFTLPASGLNYTLASLGLYLMASFLTSISEVLVVFFPANLLIFGIYGCRGFDPKTAICQAASSLGTVGFGFAALVLIVSLMLTEEQRRNKRGSL
jgi:hypothetical protein